MLLRISALTLALVLLFDSGLLSPLTKQLSQGTQLYVANVVGVGAQVAPTELNTLTAQLTERQRDLDAREAALSSREMNVGLGSGGVGGQSNELSTYILSLVLFIIVVMLVLNYALDFARYRRLTYLPQDESPA